MLSTTFLLAASMVVRQAGDSATKEQLQDMNCLVGDWICEYEVDETAKDSELLREFVGRKAVMKMTVAWVAGGGALTTDMEFIIGGKFGIKAKGLTGWDPTAKKITEYSFTNRGGCWKHSWSKTDGELIDDYVGVHLDGARLTGQRIFEMEGKDRLRMRSVNAERDGKVLPDSECVLERR